MKQMRRLSGAIVALVLTLSLFLPLGAAAEVPAEVIRVGYPIQAGFTEYSEQGGYSGYTYEYLQEIAQYTGWEYEFVCLPGTLDEQLSKMLDMLATGELDLLGGMTNAEQTQALFDFPGYSYGMAYSTLSVLEENASLTENNYQSVDGFRIAVLATASKRIANLERFCETNQIRAELVYCESDDEQLAAMRNGQADAMLGVDVVPVSGVRTIAKFASSPYYFATTKGNSEILNKLDFAILKINETDPYFAAQLNEKYFGGASSALRLSEEERAYIEASGVLRVAVAPNKQPFQYFDEETGEFQGIARGIFDRIAEDTGLRFEYLAAESHDDLIRMLETGEADCTAGIPYDYGLAGQYNVALTRPYASSQIVMIANRKTNVDDHANHRIALPMGYPFTFEANESQITYYASVEACIRAVEDGKADCAYANAYSVEYVTRQPGFRNILMIPQTGTSQRVCIGVAKPINVNLLTILNKVVRSIPDNELQSIVFRNTAPSNTEFGLGMLIDSYPRESIAVVVVAALLVMGLIAWVLHSRTAANHQVALTNERYLLLSELANEYIVEYNFRRDELTLSEKCAREFSFAPVIPHYTDMLRHYHGKEEQVARQIYSFCMEMRDKDRLNVEFLLPVGTGEKRWFRLNGMTIRGENGDPLTCIGKLVDIQKEITEREILLEKSQKDGMTNIYNSSTCRELIGEWLQTEGDHADDALLIMDVDYFKVINDRLGHFVGDRVLQQVALLLKRQFKGEHIIGRLGGDEFVVYLKNPGGAAQVEAACAELNRRASAIEAGEQIAPTLSIGAVMVREIRDFEELYRRADRALYRVKENGRNGHLVD